MMHRRAPRTVGSAVSAVALLILVVGCQVGPDPTAGWTLPDGRPWFCRSADPEGGHSGHNHVDASAYAGVPKGDLSPADCATLTTQIDKALDAARPFANVRQATAAGWFVARTYAPGWGTHHTSLDSLLRIGAFDPSHPTFLMYDGNGPDAKLVGLSYLVLILDGKPPEGFAGLNDRWHFHKSACVGPNLQIIDLEKTDQECLDRGAVNLPMQNFWMSHLWVLPGWENRSDVFADEHPCLGTTAPAPLTDPCWAVARGIGATAPVGTDPPPMAHGDH